MMRENHFPCSLKLKVGKLVCLYSFFFALSFLFLVLIHSLAKIIIQNFGDK